MDRVHQPIQPYMLQETFCNWRQGLLGHPTLLDMSLLDGTEDPYERDYELYRLVHAVMDLRLRRARSIRGIPHNPNLDGSDERCVLESLVDDARPPRGHLLAWSAVYYTYVIPITIPPERLAEATKLSLAHFSMYIGCGLSLLCDDLWLQEQTTP